MEPIIGPVGVLETKPLSKFHEHAGWGLVALAFTLPAAMMQMGIASAFDLGRAIGQSSMTFALAYIVAYFLTRKKSLRAQATGRIVVGLVVFLQAFGTFSMHKEQMDEGKVYFEKVLEMQAVQATKFAALNTKYSTMDLTKVLEPENVVTQAGRQKGAQVVAQLRAYVLERDAIISDSFNESTQLIAGIQSAEVKRGALEGMRETAEANKRMYADLTAKQYATADAILAILAWCEKQPNGSLAIEDGKLIFTTVEQQTQLQALIATLNEAETAQAKVIEAVTATANSLETKKAEMRKMIPD